MDEASRSPGVVQTARNGGLRRPTDEEKEQKVKAVNAGETGKEKCRTEVRQS